MYNNPARYTDPSGNNPWNILKRLLAKHTGIVVDKYTISQMSLGGMCPNNSCSPYARYETTVDYMRSEMVRNAQGVPAQAAKALNEMGLETAAKGIWLWMAHPNAQWDHKPNLTAMLGLNQNGIADAYFPIPGDDEYEYFYDIYSNIHFGYVSAAAGFDEATVQAGAASFEGGRNDEYDILSVHIGYELWEQTGGDPERLTEEMIGRAILGHRSSYYRRDQTGAAIDRRNYR